MDKRFNNITFLAKQRKKNFRPFLFVETHFERKKEMVIAMAMTEKNRRLKVSPAILTQPEAIQKLIIGEICQTHYRASKQSLVIWGDIQAYKLFLAPTTAWLFDISGQFISVINEPIPEKATAWITTEDEKREPLFD